MIVQPLSIGLIKEGKIPTDKRVPLTPDQVEELLSKYPEVELKCQRSDIRCFANEAYANAGAALCDDVTGCDVILGVKEVPVEMLAEGKTHFFFSHTIKKQSYNRSLLQAMLNKNIRLIDWECLTDTHGRRLIAFGRYAGIVGAYNAILTFGQRYNLFHLRPAHQCFDLDDLKSEFEKVKLPKIKIVLTGGGRVAKGAIEVLAGMQIRKVSPAELLHEVYDEPVFAQLNSRDYHLRKDGAAFNRDDFYANPSAYDSDFLKFARKADVLIAGAFWDPEAPVLFTREDMTHLDFKLRVIADITCDIEGSIPSTKRSTTIEDPLYDYNPDNDREEPPFTDEGNVTVMAVDNLPCELPRNASHDFGREFLRQILPSLLGDDQDRIIGRATITDQGALTPEFKYLQGYVDGTE